MIRVGLVGVGFMGWIHHLAYQRSNKAKMAAFCSRDAAKRSGDWRSIKGNFGPPGEQISLDGIAVFETYDEMLKSASIDVVDICLPPHLHTESAIKAIEHGKDVFIEKPMALTGDDCRKVLDAAEANGRLVMVAHVLPYMGAFSYATKLVQQGVYGKPIGGYFKRVISNPTWISDFFEPDRVGGPLVDLHVHDLHWIQLLFGVPSSVDVVGRMRGQVAEYVHVLHRFADPSVCVSSSSGVLDAPGRPFTHGFELHLEHAILQHEFAAYNNGSESMNLRIATQTGEVLMPELPNADEVDAFREEIDDMADSVQSRRIAPRLNGELACQAVELALTIQSKLVS